MDKQGNKTRKYFPIRRQTKQIYFGMDSNFIALVFGFDSVKEYEAHPLKDRIEAGAKHCLKAGSNVDLHIYSAAKTIKDKEIEDWQDAYRLIRATYSISSFSDLEIKVSFWVSKIIE